MKNNAKKAKSAAAVTTLPGQSQSSIDPSVNYAMESGTLPPASMLLHSNESHHPLAPHDSPMNPYPDLYNSRSSGPSNTKTNKRKLEELADPASNEFDSSSSLKPQKTEQIDSERSISRTGTPLSNGPPPSLTPSRNSNDIGPPSYEFAPSTNNHNNNNHNGNSTPNSSLLTQQTPPPPPSLHHQQSLPPPGSSYMHMSPRNQYGITSDSPFLQTNNQVFVFTTQLANEAAESVLNNEYPSMVEYHKSLPSTAQYLSSLSNNNHNPLLAGPPMHMNGPPGCHSPRTMQMMMSGPPHHNPHMAMHNGNVGPPPNWPHPHFHPQQPPFGRLTPGPGGLPPPSHLMPPGTMMMMNGGSPSPGIRMGGMPHMPGMGPMPSDGIENLTPERAKHRKNQLNKIADLKTKITSGRGRGGRSKANAAAAAAAVDANMSPSMNGGPLPPGALDPHQQQMMMMNSPHGGGPPHHMMGIGPPPPHMLPPGMRGPPDGMMMDMNGPPHGYMNGPMPPGYHGQFGGPNDPYGQIPPPHQQAQAVREWNKMQMEHLEGKAQQMRGQPPPYSSGSPSSLTPPIASTSAGNMMGPNGKLLSPRMEPCGAPRLYKVGQPEKFIPDALPSSGNKKMPGNLGEVQLTSSPTQMDYNEFGMEGEELMITRHLNRAYRSGNGNNAGPPMPSSSSSCKDEPMTPSQRSTSTPNNNSNLLASGQQQPLPPGSTTPTHHSQGPPSHHTPQSVPAASPRSSKQNSNLNNNNLSSPLMLSNNNSTKDEPLDLNGDPKTPTSNMAPPLSSMLQMTNNLQSANSPYSSANNPGSKSSMASPNYGHMSKPMDHMNPSPQHMQFQNMNPHHRMIGPPDSMPPYFNPHHPGNLPPPHHHMYKMMPPHHPMDPNGMMMSHPHGPSRSSKGLPPPPSSQSSSDPMQQHLHHLPPGHYMKMHNMDSMHGPPPPGHPQQYMRFPPMMDDGFNMGPPPHQHPHMHSHMHPHHPMHLNDSRLPPPPPQSINNTYVSATMSIQQLNIQNLGPGGPAGELQAGTIHYHAPSSNGPDSQQQQPYPGNDPSFSSQFNDLQGPPSNLSGDGVQPPTYW